MVKAAQFDSMKKLSRRKFLESSGGALAATISFSGMGSAKAVTPAHSTLLASGIPAIAADDGKKPLRLGLIIGIGKEGVALLDFLISW